MISYRIYSLLIIGHFQVVCEAFGQLIIQSVVLLRLKTLIQECANMEFIKKSKKKCRFSSTKIGLKICIYNYTFFSLLFYSSIKLYMYI